MFFQIVTRAISHFKAALQNAKLQTNSHTHRMETTSECDNDRRRTLTHTHIRTLHTKVRKRTNKTHFADNRGNDTHGGHTGEEPSIRPPVDSLFEDCTFNVRKGGVALSLIDFLKLRKALYFKTICFFFCRNA